MESEFSSSKPADATISSGSEDAAPAPDEAPPVLRVGETILKIPPILLEDDDRDPAATETDDAEFARSLAPAELEAPPELPETYGTQKVSLTARDPHWLCAHWDFTRQQLQEYTALASDGELGLRIQAGDAPEPVRQVRVEPNARHWFVHVEKADEDYVAQFGFANAGGGWTCISASAPTRTPPEIQSTNESVQFATVPAGLPMERMQQIVIEGGLGHLPLVEGIERLRAAGHPEIVVVTAAEQASGFGQPATAREFAGAQIDFPQLQRGDENPSSQAAALFGLPTSPGGISSPFGGQPEKRFWLTVNAELIVYGATEANATVTIGGREIKLLPDGSFSFRFALPDGTFELPVVAISADGVESRGAELNFSRATQLRGEVGVHPQEPALKIPAPENL